MGLGEGLLVGGIESETLLARVARRVGVCVIPVLIMVGELNRLTEREGLALTLTVTGVPVITGARVGRTVGRLCEWVGMSKDPVR